MRHGLSWTLGIGITFTTSQTKADPVVESMGS